jgi:hypothetical protein
MGMRVAFEAYCITVRFDLIVAHYQNLPRNLPPRTV